MILFKKIPFSFEEKNYEIQIFYDDTLINVIAFHNHYPVNGIRHQIKISKKISMQGLLEQEVVGELVEMSKRDIIEKRWERLFNRT
ncbi:MAG: hypothetical protein PHD29_02640 [bacterium]|nr:hypothetical protein [bacterium]MDD5755956.1 hypothetical protein [bacterium]